MPLILASTSAIRRQMLDAAGAEYQAVRPQVDEEERKLGLTQANEIAEQLYLSVRTVESHRAHIQQKLSMTTRSELVRYAIERGLIDV